MAINKKQTQPKITTLAVKTMNSKSASQIAKSLGASALAQTNTTKQTSVKMETIASKVLSSVKYSKETNIDFAEERRLMYVAITRAKKEVWIESDYNEMSPDFRIFFKQTP